MTKPSYLPDADVLIARAFEVHTHHQMASEWFHTRELRWRQRRDRLGRYFYNSKRNKGVNVPSGRCEEIGKCAHTVIVTYAVDLYRGIMGTLPNPPLPRLASIDRSQLLLHTVDD